MNNTPIPLLDALLVPLLMMGAIFLAVLIATRFLFKKRRSPRPVRTAYQRQPALLTQAEQLFFTALRSAIGNHFLLFAKVRLADLLAVSKTQRGAAFYRAFNPIAQKHVDFVLCDTSTLAIIAVVELDDKSHQPPDRQQSDAFKNTAFASAEIPFLRFSIRANYDREDIRTAIQDKIDFPKWRVKAEAPAVDAEHRWQRPNST